MMRALGQVRAYPLLSGLVCILYSLHLGAQPNSATREPEIKNSVNARDGQHDFDFEIGAWKTRIRRLDHPLTGATTWIEYEGTTVARKVWNGRANLVEVEADAPGSHFEGLSLRLYNPESHQWSLSYANSKGGTLSVPSIGEFKNGRGEFFDTELLDGRSILVRNVWSDVSENSCRFEQAFSDDGGKTWEVNWIATNIRMKEMAKSESGPATSVPHQTPGERDAQHDFDWDIGAWKAHMRRLLHPLTGSATWVEYDGTDVVRKVWDGRANLGEVELDGPAGHLELLTLRLYNPQAHQWNINIAAAGVLSPPAIGEFKNGRGEFIDQETYNGKSILVRFGISDITPNSARFDQAFSADGGKTWEVNLIVTETLVKDESATAR